MHKHTLKRRAGFRFVLAFILAVFGGLLSIAGCDNVALVQDDVAEADSFERMQLLTLQLNWRADAQHGGFYQAVVDGEYEAEGLDVKIVQGGPGSPVIPKLVMGRVDFAIANADQILQVREQEADIVGVMAPMQHSPRCIMVHQSTGITEFDQLRDMTLGMNEGRTFAIFLKSNLQLDGVRIVPYGGLVAKFLLDEKFAQQGYVFSEPLVAKEQGGDPHSLMVSDLGFDPYSSCVAVQSKRIQDDPDLVKKFVAASRRGWMSYLQSPERANQEINRVNPDMDIGSLNNAAAILKELCLPDGLTQESFGWMTQERWLELAKAMHDIKAIKLDPQPASAAAWVDLR